MNKNPLLFHRTFGEKENPCILILHGLLGCSDNWMTVAKNLSSDYFVLIVDLRNHGQSFHHKSMLYSEMAEDVENLINELDLKDVTLIGHSMGGKVTMECLKRKNIPFKSSVVVDIAPKAYKGEHAVILSSLQSLDLMVSDRSSLDSQLSKNIDSFILRQFLLKTITRKNGCFEFKINLDSIILNYESILDFCLEEGDDFCGKGYDTHFEQEDLGDDLFKSSIPVLFMKGDRSSYILNDDYVLIRKIFKNSFFEVIENAGHWAHSENYIFFIHILRKFLKSTI
ncbi:alpha/beta fold hydrolase [bacterium]|jgi:esterase|nr:alpha/beta fold hydrolase [bacterium]